MDIQVITKTVLRLSRFDLEDFNVSLVNKTTRYSAIAMFVTSLARCTFAVLEHFAERLKITTENILINLTWDFIDDPTRISQITMIIIWPELPNNRIASVTRASHQCTISSSIKKCITINTSVFNNENETNDNF